MQLSSQKEYSEPDEWTNLGKLEKIELTKDIFDDLFRRDGWVDGYYDYSEKDDAYSDDTLIR